MRFGVICYAESNTPLIMPDDMFNQAVCGSISLWLKLSNGSTLISGHIHVNVWQKPL